jgi:hypothetical protein
MTIFSINDESKIRFNNEISTIFFISEHLISKIKLEQLSDHIYFGKEFWSIQRLGHFIKEIEYIPEHVMYLLHEKYNIDIVRCITSLSNEQNNWTDYNTFFNVLPDIYKDNNQLYSLIHFFHEKIMNSKASQLFNGSLESIAANNTQFVDDYLSKLVTTKDDVIYFFAPSIMSGYLSHKKTNDMHAVLSSLENTNNSKLHEVIIGTIGILIYKNNSDEYIQFFTEYLNRLDQQEWNHQNPKLMWAYALLYKYNKSVLKLMENMITPDSLDVVDEFTSFLFRAENYDLPLEKFDKLLYNLSNYKLNITAIRNCDSLLYRHFDDNSKLIWDFVENWIFKHEFENEIKWSIPKQFTSLFSKIITHNGCLSEKLTTWLRIENFGYQYEISNWLSAISTHQITNLELDTNVLEKYTPIDFIFVARKISVLAFDYKLLCSLLFSMIKYKNLSRQLENELESIFTQYVMFNYPDFTNDFLDSKLTNASNVESDFINRIKDNWSVYSERLEKLPHLKESKIPNDVLKYYQKRQQEQMNEIRNKPSDRPLASLFSNNVTIKYGNSWAHQMDGTYTDASKMMESSYSVPLPRNSQIDPISFQIFRISNRYLRKEDIKYDVNN